MRRLVQIIFRTALSIAYIVSTFLRDYLTKFCLLKFLLFVIEGTNASSLRGDICAAWFESLFRVICML